jgi:hypothetical protein
MDPAAASQSAPLRRNIAEPVVHALVAGAEVDPVGGQVAVQHRGKPERTGAPHVVPEGDVVALDLPEQPDRRGDHRADRGVKVSNRHDP